MQMHKAISDYGAVCADFYGAKLAPIFLKEEPAHEPYPHAQHWNQAKSEQEWMINHHSDRCSNPIDGASNKRANDSDKAFNGICYSYCISCTNNQHANLLS